MPSFSQLLRNSRFSRFDPSLPQVYKTYGEYHQRGEYGVKRNLPNLRTNAVTIETIDTIEHQTPYKSAETLTRFTRKFKENFLNTKRANPLKLSDVHKRSLKDISKMSKREFEKLLKQIEKKKDEWNKLMTDTTYDPEDFLEFLGLTVDTRSSTSIVKGLTYSHNNPGVNYQIQGRILNRDANGVFAVGINGLVGSLHFGKTQKLTNVNRMKLDNFYVEKVEFDDQGYPNIRVSHTPLLSQNNLNILDYLPGKPSLFFDSATNKVEDNDNKFQEEILSKLRSLIRSGESTTSNEEKPKPPTKPGFQTIYEEMVSKEDSKMNFKGNEEKEKEKGNEVLQENDNNVKTDEFSTTIIESNKKELPSKFQTANELFKDLLDYKKSD